ncbi:hypothetical protein GOV14_00010 [Candidatus Pacearchaeota archaeon]|nr:hypothetical protein [Candidatus Pacearchaeota archaeon]
MATIKLVYLSLIILLIGLVNAAPPSLPVSIYGKVINDGKAISGVDVVSSWIDTNNKIQIFSTKTLNSKQAQTVGNSQLKGYYKIQVDDFQQNNYIIIEAVRGKIKILASPGEIIQAPDIEVSDLDILLDKIGNIFAPKDKKKDKESYEPEKEKTEKKQKEEEEKEEEEEKPSQNQTKEDEKKNESENEEKEQQSKDFCNETDTGRNFYEKGKTCDSSNCGEDQCLTEQTLTEVYCLDNKIVEIVVTCPGKCVDGACFLGQETLRIDCIDNDANKIYLYGANPTSKGITSNNTGHYTDFCTENLLTEYSCGKIIGSIEEQEIECEHGCFNGTCLEKPEEVDVKDVETIKSRDKDLFVIDDANYFISKDKELIRSEVKLSKTEDTIHATLSDGSLIEIKLHLDEVTYYVEEVLGSSEIKDIKLVEYEENIVYEVKYKKRGKMLKFLAMDYTVRSKINANSKEVIETKKSWWARFLKEF